MRSVYVLFAVVAVLLFSVQSGAAAKSSPIAGRWQTVRTCQDMVGALQAAGLRPLAPGMVGEYFPNQTPQQLAKKKNLCQGAKPQIHSHFFTANGAFGSVDQHGEQVDDGTYQANGATLKIGNSDVSGSFRFRIQGKTLMLRPLLTPALKQEALADPLNFHPAGWMVAVALNGKPWNRVACKTWC
jgi:hypothetical protein